jgi:hypothetical protein
MFGDIYSPVGEQLVVLGLVLLGFLRLVCLFSIFLSFLGF